MGKTAIIFSAGLLCLALASSARAAGYGQQVVSYVPNVPGEYEYGFVDVFTGFGSPDMEMRFSNSKNPIMLNNTAANDLGLGVASLSSNTTYKTVVFDNLSTSGSGPIAVRFGRFGKGALGGDVELSYEKREVKKQTAAWKLNGRSGSVPIAFDDYATVESYRACAGLLVRYPGKLLDPYIGLGLGISLNQITLPYVKGFTGSSNLSKPVEELAIGLTASLPAGLRIKAGRHFHVVTELRYEINHIFFDRGDISGESDTITLSGFKFIAGLGYAF